MKRTEDYGKKKEDHGKRTEDYERRTEDYWKRTEDYGRWTEDYGKDGRLREEDGKLREEDEKLREDYGGLTCCLTPKVKLQCGKAKNKSHKVEIELPKVRKKCRPRLEKKPSKVSWKYPQDPRFKQRRARLNKAPSLKQVVQGLKNKVPKVGSHGQGLQAPQKKKRASDGSVWSRTSCLWNVVLEVPDFIIWVQSTSVTHINTCIYI